MNDVKEMFRSKFTNLGGKLRSDKNSHTDSFTLPTYAEVLYISSKNDKDVYNELYKKMSTICVQNYSVTDDKKMKKNSWESLLNLLTESEKKLSNDTLIKEVMANSVKALDEMAHATKEFDRILSSNVIKHFHDLSEDNTLTIAKKSFTSLSKDMKANTEKVHILQDQLNIPSNDSLPYRKPAEISSQVSTENKLASAQILEENTEKEWENKKDLYLSKLFANEAEKFTTAEKYLEFFQDHFDYYAECQRILSKVIPEIKSTLDRNKHIYAFNVLLEDHLTATNRKLSYVLETCIQELDNEETLQHEGLFRISGGKSKMELLKNALNVMRIDDFITRGFDSAVYAGVLKQYLRELPIPLMTYDLYDKWCEIGAKIRQDDLDSTVQLAKLYLSQMPPCYYDNLVYLMQFLRKIIEYEPINKMGASNLGLMLGPNLIRNKHGPDNEDGEASVMLIIGSPGASVLEFMITHCTELFPEIPVFTIAARSPLKVHEISVNDIDDDKNLKKIKETNDSDSLPSTDLLTDDSVSITVSEFDDSKKCDEPLRSSRDLPVDLGVLRKLGSPPPPPQNKPYLIDNERDNVKELILTGSENCPAVKKRISKLDQRVSDPIKDLDTSLTDYSSRRVTSSQIVQRPNYLPQIPPKKPTHNIVLAPERPPMRPENPPPRRPNNPPPTVTPFSKLKENPDQAHQSADSAEEPSTAVDLQAPINVSL